MFSSGTLALPVIGALVLAVAVRFWPRRRVLCPECRAGRTGFDNR